MLSNWRTIDINLHSDIAAMHVSLILISAFRYWKCAIVLLTKCISTIYSRVFRRAYGLAIHVTNLLFYSVFLASLTTFICTYPPRNHFDMPVGQSNATGSHGSMYYQVCLYVMQLFGYIFCLMDIDDVNMLFIIPMNWTVCWRRKNQCIVQHDKSRFI